MKSRLYHIQLNIDFKNATFYKELFAQVGWSVIFEADHVVGFTSGSNGDIWVVRSEEGNSTQNHHHNGMNHIALMVDNQQDVDEMASFLTSKGVKMLFDTPRHRSEFASSKEHTYYQIMFESPDKVLFEIVYIGKK